MHKGNELQKAREKIKMTQEVAAGLTGISPEHLSRIENNRVTPRVKTLAALKKALGI